MIYFQFVCCVLLVIRAELTAVHSSVLQQELESCRLLLEEEPNNKCKYSTSSRWNSGHSCGRQAVSMMRLYCSVRSLTDPPFRHSFEKMTKLRNIAPPPPTLAHNYCGFSFSILCLREFYALGAGFMAFWELS